MPKIIKIITQKNKIVYTLKSVYFLHYSMKFKAHTKSDDKLTFSSTVNIT